MCAWIEEGDSVICINNRYVENMLTLGKEYIVISTKNPLGKGIRITVADDMGHKITCIPNRFMKKEE